MNRQARRQKPRKRNSHKGDLGIKAQLVRETAIDIAVVRHMELFSWLIIVALNDEAGWGQTRIRRFSQRVEELRREWDEMRRETDMEYANEKLRLRVEKIVGEKINYFAEDRKENCNGT